MRIIGIVDTIDIVGSLSIETFEKTTEKTHKSIFLTNYYIACDIPLNINNTFFDQINLQNTFFHQLREDILISRIISIAVKNINAQTNNNEITI
jgi:hypothetical protein